MDNKNQIELNRIAALHAKFNGQPVTLEQQVLVDEFLNSHDLANVPFDEEVIKRMDGHDQRIDGEYAEFQKSIKMAAGLQVVPQEQVVDSGKGILIRMLAYAACLILLLGGIVFYFKWKQHRWLFSEDRHQIAGQIQGGSYQAILYLSDHKEKYLDSNAMGVIAKENGVSVISPGAGYLTYESTGAGSSERLTNMLITPRAGTYKVKLPDKTVMYLNAETTVQYPISFDSSVREVTLLSGEAYFEVVPDKRPFIVKTANYNIDVLGTKFNVNAYGDEGITKTTLVSGNIQLRAARTYKLKPGQQALTLPGNKEIKILDNVDTGVETSWKDGYFNFMEVELSTIMKQVARWYDVKVVIESELESNPITMTSIPRTLHLEEFLDILKHKYHFNFAINIEKKEVIITR